MASPQLSLALVPAAAMTAPQRILLPNPADEAQAESRLAIIQQIFDFKRDPERFSQLRLQDGNLVKNISRMVAYVAETTGVSERTIHRWMTIHDKAGKAGLADRKRRDKGSSRFFDAHPKAAWLVAYLYLTCRASRTVCFEALVRDPAMVEVSPEELPCYDTVCAWLDSMPASLTVYAREGQKAYRERMSPYLKRGFTDVFANQVWVGDQMIHDVEAMNDVFTEAEWGAPVRIRLDAMIDYRSRKVVGASWAWEGSSRSIGATMRRGVSQYGPPECWYVDNGKPYKKAAKDALPGYLMNSPLAPQDWRKQELESIAASGFLARLGIATQHCMPFHPQAKCIERFFGTVHERFDRCWPTYTSGSPATRPEATEAAMVRHRKLMKHGQVSKSEHPRVSQIIAGCLAWMEEYADTVHEGEGMDGGTPNQVFDANRNPNQKPPPDPAALALLMAERTQRSVRECAITLNHRRYMPTDQTGWATLHNLNEDDGGVLIAYNSGDPECAAALDLDGHFLAWLQAEELVKFAPGDPHTSELISESMAQRRRLEKGTRGALAAITTAARANGAQSPLEAMAARLQLPATTDLSGVVTQRAPRLAAANPIAAPATPAEAARLYMKRQAS